MNRIVSCSFFVFEGLRLNNDVNKMVYVLVNGERDIREKRERGLGMNEVNDG